MFASITLKVNVKAATVAQKSTTLHVALSKCKADAEGARTAPSLTNKRLRQQPGGSAAGATTADLRGASGHQDDILVNQDRPPSKQIILVSALSALPAIAKVTQTRMSLLALGKQRSILSPKECLWTPITMLREQRDTNTTPG